MIETEEQAKELIAQFHLSSCPRDDYYEAVGFLRGLKLGIAEMFDKCYKIAHMTQPLKIVAAIEKIKP